MASAPPAHDPALSHVPPPSATAQQATGAHSAQNAAQPALPASLIPGMANEQIMALLKHIPDFLTRGRVRWPAGLLCLASVLSLAPGGDLKDSAAAEALSNLSQTAFLQQQVPQQAHPGQYPPHPMHAHPQQQQQQQQHNGMGSEPGPSSHPRGPPNLGQLSAVASALQANAPPAPSSSENRPQSAGHDAGAPQESPSGGEGDSPDTDRPTPAPKSNGRRGGRNPTMTNDEWARLRKDNHKEVERRRRGNINEGINELGRIVPNGSGEKAKGAILSRAVQYIHHLKENEARNIEKWTLEKLLMDQAMGDLQAQLEEMRRMWEEERVARQRAEAELELLRGHGGPAAPASAAGATTALATAAATAAASGGAPAATSTPALPVGAGANENGKREREADDAADEQAVEGEVAPAEGDDRAKRPRVE
ncbi:hypothetical protein BD413DRAFT_492474 [Trametes elegans]|nr:hypothetical protein BD413DRAFT_492474 [Trametes elegans]